MNRFKHKHLFLQTKLKRLQQTNESKIRQALILRVKLIKVFKESQ